DVPQPPPDSRLRQTRQLAGKPPRQLPLAQRRRLTQLPSRVGVGRRELLPRPGVCSAINAPSSILCRSNANLTSRSRPLGPPYPALACISAVRRVNGTGAA